MLEIIRAIQGVYDHVYAESTEYLGNCILYTFHTLNSDRISERITLKVTIITGTMAEGLALEDKVKGTLLTFGDAPFSRNITAVALNGGGVLEDMAREKIHRILYFNIIKKF